MQSLGNDDAESSKRRCRVSETTIDDDEDDDDDAESRKQLHLSLAPRAMQSLGNDAVSRKRRCRV